MIPADPADPAFRRDRPLLLLLAAGLLLRLGLAWASFPYLAWRGPLIDDAFYSFSIARNLAAGSGPTADGIHETSGFQPLYTSLLVPFYLLFPRDPILPIHMALTLLALCGSLTGWFLYRVVRRVASRRAAVFALALWTFSPYFLTHGENGLETGLFGLALAATLDYHLAKGRTLVSTRDSARLGLLLGLTILSRVDGLLFATAVAYDLMRRPRAPGERLRHLVVASSVALATVSPYLLFLALRFGAILPASGSATRFLSLCYGTRFTFGARSVIYFPPGSVPWTYYLGSLRKAIQALCSEPLLFPLSPFLCVASLAGFFTPRTLLRVLGGGALLFANLLALKRPAGAGEDAWKSLVRVGAVSASLWIPAYAFGILGQWWFGRYFFPLFLFMTLFSGPALDRLGGGLAVFRRLGPARFFAVALSLHLFLFALQTPEKLLRHKPYLNISEYLTAARLLDDVLPPGSRAGAFQSGTLSYFSRRTVINLDGVVNPAAEKALRDGKVAPYIRQEGIEAVIDWPWILEALLVRRSPAGTTGEALGRPRPARSAYCPESSGLPGRTHRNIHFPFDFLPQSYVTSAENNQISR